MASLALPIMGAAGSLLGGLFGSSASSQYQDALKKAEGVIQGDQNQDLQNYQPYLDAGKGATNTLSSLLGTPGQGLLQNWTGQFTAPTAEQAAQTPGYQFQVKQGEDAMQNSAAAKGSLLTGRTMADLNNYAQGTASTNYQNTFNNDLTQYNSAYNTFQNNQNNQYNRLMGMSGLGLNAANGASTALQGFGGDMASLIGQQGAVRAGGTMALGNGISGALGTLGSGFMLRGMGGLGGNSSSGGSSDMSSWN